MYQLDTAFLARQGVKSCEHAEWGESFFRLLDRNYSQWGHDPVTVYAAACQILNTLAYKRPDEELGISLLHNPEAFLRTVLIMLRHQ